MMSERTEPSWIHDPDTILFVTDDEPLAAGAVEQHGLGDTAGRLFGQAKDHVKADWTKTVDQMRFLLDGLTPSSVGYRVSEVTFELAFTATGGVAFIAGAGLTSSVSVTFQHKPEAGDT
jgi:hypothetical protein